MLYFRVLSFEFTWVSQFRAAGFRLLSTRRMQEPCVEFNPAYQQPFARPFRLMATSRNGTAGLFSPLLSQFMPLQHVLASACRACLTVFNMLLAVQTDFSDASLTCWSDAARIPVFARLNQYRRQHIKMSATEI